MSTKEQLKGDSKRRQDKAIKEYAEKQGYILAKKVEDIGFSAFKGDHRKEESNRKKQASFIKIIKAFESGEFDTSKNNYYLIIENMDRLSRQEVNKSIKFLIEILEIGVKLITLFDQKLYEYETLDQINLMYAIMYLSKAHKESEDKSKRLADVFKEKRKNALEKKTVLTRKCPAWLEVLTDENNNLYYSKIDDRVKIIETIFEKTVFENYGKEKLRNYLNNELKVPSFTGKTWGSSYITKLLRDRRLLGFYQPKTKFEVDKKVKIGDEIPDYYPQIISISLFKKVEDQIISRISAKDGKVKGGRNGSLTNLFKGVVKCQKCGANMHYKSSSHKNLSYLECEKKRTSLCDSKAIRYEYFEKAFFYLINEIDFKSVFNNKNYNKKQKHQQRLIDDLNNKNADISDQIKRLVQLASLNASVEIKEISAQIEELNFNKIRNENKIEQYKSTILSDVEENSLTETTSIYEAIKANNDISKRVLLNNLIKSNFSNIIFDGDSKTAIVYFNIDEFKSILFSLFKVENSKIILTEKIENITQDLAFFVPINRKFNKAIDNKDLDDIERFKALFKLKRLERKMFSKNVEMLHSDKNISEILNDIVDEIKYLVKNDLDVPLDQIGDLDKEKLLKCEVNFD